MHKRTALAFAAAVLIALPTSAGIHYRAVTTTEGPPGAGMGDLTVEGWVSGEKAKVEFAEVASDQPFLGKGSYLLTRDGGETVYLVNPDDRTYSKWDLDAMVRTAGALFEAMGGLARIEFSEPEIQKLGDEPGPSIAGLPTRHLRFRTEYTMRMRVMGMRSETRTVSEEDIWVTQAVAEPGFGVWLRRSPPQTGNEEFDKLLRAQMTMVDGIPLKVITATTTTDERRGESQTVTMTMEVTELQQTSLPDATFAMPQGYREVDLLPQLEQGQEGEDGGPLRGLFGRGRN